MEETGLLVQARHRALFKINKTAAEVQTSYTLTIIENVLRNTIL